MTTGILGHVGLTIAGQCFLAALGSAQSINVGAGREQPRFVERPGYVEFSGQMIVRPLQSSELRGRGLAPEQIDAVRQRAAARVAGFVLEYISETDEFIVRVPPNESENTLAARLMSTGEYEYAEPDWICRPTTTIPNDGGYWQQWHHPKVRSSLAWDITVGDPSVVIAIVDGGVELSHPDLAGALVPGYNAASRTTQAAGGLVGDVDGHGTFVAGLAGAIGNNGTHVVGMGWSFSIMPVRYYNSPGGGFLSNLLNGARWAVTNGAKCINVSQTGVDNASVQTTGAFITSNGGLLFWAAGNDGRDLSWFDWNDVIIVGGTDQADNRTACSAYGLAVDVFAPGVDILSTGINGALAISGCGTSAATPMAAGIAGLVWSANPCLSPQQVQNCLFSGCVDKGDPGNDTAWGWGRVDSYGAVQGCKADVNRDGFVNGDDFDQFVLAFEAGSACADFDLNGWVTGDDFDAFVIHFEIGC